MVDAEEEIALTVRIRKGDMAALEALVNANLRFVFSVAKQYQNQGVSLNDLVNEGMCENKKLHFSDHLVEVQLPAVVFCCVL